MPKLQSTGSGLKPEAARENLLIVETTLELREICDALRISPDEAISKFRDPRITSLFAEIWGERLFGYKAHVNSNHPGSDASLKLGNLGRFDISVRCISANGIKFQKSKSIGSGRSGDLEDLIGSIEAVERYVVVDLRGFPTLRFFPFDSKSLLRLVRQGRLKPSGLSSNRFDHWALDAFNVSVISISLPLHTEPMPVD